MRRFRGGVGGFSLLELLVAVAVVALLAALLFPVTGRVMQTVRATQCAGNLRQIGMALEAYTQDHDGRYPPRGIPGIANSVFTWVGKDGDGVNYQWGVDRRYLNSYLGVTEEGDPCKVARCPSEQGTALYELTGSSYSANANALLPYNVIDSTNTPIKKVVIDNPSRFVVMAEHGATDMVWGARRTSWHRSIDGKEYWNLLFADGHVALTAVGFREWQGPDYSYRYHEDE
jgi:prepilin-type N-terminal cleavage/methylation domain-containing protein